MKPFVLFLYFLTTLLAGGPSASWATQPFAQQSTNPFLIQPYVYTIKGGELAVSWSYNGHPKAEPVIDVFQNGARDSVRAFVEKDLMTAVLPFAPCGFGSVAFRVPGMTAPQTIADVPCRDSKALSKFVMLADTQEGVSYDHEFDEQIKSFGTNALILGGDLVQDGSDGLQWLKFFSAMSDVLRDEMTIPVVGNHEYRFNKAVPYWSKYFHTDAGDAYYTVDVGAAHLIVLNSSFEDDKTLALKELVWLKRELEKPARWKIVVFHHPPYASSIMHSQYYPRKEYVTLRNDFVPLFEQYGVRLVLNGHTHFYEHSMKDGIHYVTTGPAGGHMGIAGVTNPYSVALAKVRTMVQVETTAAQLRLTATTIDGHVIDSFILDRLQEGPELHLTQSAVEPAESTISSEVPLRGLEHQSPALAPASIK